jgi:predicted DNA-binding antitoxin AbrB/MazE fold protein
MTVAVEVIYENGVLRPEKPLGFKEHAKVCILVEDESEAQPAAEAHDAAGWAALDALIGIGQALATDVSERHDDYLHGAPHA